MSNSFLTPGTVAHQSPLSMEFPRQEYQSGFPFPSPDLPKLGSYLGLLIAGGFFTAETPEKPSKTIKLFFCISPKILSLRFTSVSGYRG